MMGFVSQPILRLLIYGFVIMINRCIVFSNDSQVFLQYLPKFVLKRCPDNYPKPPRSACRFCPFHSDEEWLRLKNEEPSEFMLSVEFEKKLQEAANRQEVLKGIPYLHNTCVPIGEIDFSAKSKESHRQISMFGNECEVS